LNWRSGKRAWSNSNCENVHFQSHCSNEQLYEHSVPRQTLIQILTTKVQFNFLSWEPSGRRQERGVHVSGNIIFIVTEKKNTSPLINELQIIFLC
jgi:hypothetical protein